jgi:hypothetical protein
MFVHQVVSGFGNGEATVLISGDAVFTHAGEMQAALGEALDACQHLTIDVGCVDALDGTFRVLLCALHRRSELGNKSISMQGVLPGWDDDQSRYATKGCLFRGANERCPLWESLVRGGAGRRRLS